MIILMLLSSVFSFRVGEGIGPIVLVGAVLGFWYSPVLLRRYRLTQRLKDHWGWPRFTVVDLMSLTAWIAIIVLIASSKTTRFRPVTTFDHADRQFLIVVGSLAVVSIIYLWFRAVWLMQQCQINEPSRRLVFLLVVIPAALLANVDAGMSVVTLLSTPFVIAAGITGRIGNDPPVFAIASVLICPPVELILLTVLIRRGMSFVLQEKIQPKPVAIE